MTTQDDTSTMQDLVDEVVSFLGVQAAILVVRDESGRDEMVFAGLKSRHDVHELIEKVSRADPSR